MAPFRYREAHVRLVSAATHAARSVWLLALIGAGCASPSYARFYERYAGTCQVAQPTAAAASLPRGAASTAFVAALDEQEGKLRECYTDALHYGETHGTVRLRVTLGPEGRPDPVTVVADSTTFPALACCVVAVVRELRVPAPALSFEYPFSFRTLRTTDAVGLGVPWSRSGADLDGYIAELDESTVVIGGILLYPVANDRLHYYSDDAPKQ